MITLNNKNRTVRSIIMTAAAVLAIGGAMAKSVSQTDTTYGVTGQDDNYYYVTTSSGTCSSSSSACKVSSSVSPDSQNRIAKSQANVTQSGTFQED